MYLVESKQCESIWSVCNARHPTDWSSSATLLRLTRSDLLGQRPGVCLEMPRLSSVKSLAGETEWMNELPFSAFVRPSRLSFIIKGVVAYSLELLRCLVSASAEKEKETEVWHHLTEVPHLLTSHIHHILGASRCISASFQFHLFNLIDGLN